MAGPIGPRLRARHDAGRSSRVLVRMLVLAGSFAVTAGLVTLGAGLMHRGPLAWIGG